MLTISKISENEFQSEDDSDGEDDEFAGEDVLQMTASALSKVGSREVYSDKRKAGAK
jgi:hypothetical protein